MTSHAPLPAALVTLLERIRDNPPYDAAAAAAELAELSIRPDDLLPWADYDHPSADSYGRKLVARGANFELMVMSWAPGDYSAIHDHGVAQWGAVLYLGAAEHVVFEIDQNVLHVAERMTTRPGLVYPVGHSLIHLMGNPGDTAFLSLHLYGRSAPSHSITGDARIFDLWEQRIQRTDGGVFYSLPEDDITWREPCPHADLETTILHHRLMLARIERMTSTDPSLSRRADALRDRITELEAPPDLRVAL